METRRWSIESYDELRKRITGAVEQKQLLIEAAKKDIQDEEKKKMLTMAPMESLVTEYFDGEHWVMLTCEEEFLEALRVMKQQNSDLITFRVGPAKVFKKCHGMGMCGGHRRWWMHRRMGAGFEHPPHHHMVPETEDSDEHESSDEKEEIAPVHFPVHSPFGFMNHKWGGRHHHHHHHHRKHHQEAVEKQECQNMPEEAAPAFPRFGKHCRGGRKWKKWLERHQQRVEESKEEPKTVEEVPQEADPEQVVPVVEQEKQEESVLPEISSPEAPEPSQWSDAHQVLHSMGFTNWKLNEHLLVHHRGNVAQVVTALLKLNA